MSHKSEKKEGLEKVYVDLPNHWAVSGESMWAKPLGNDLYEIRNIPFYAYGLNFLDKVKVDSSDENHKPIVLEVVESSGFKTIRLSFEVEDFDEDKQNKLFKQLKEFGVDVERDNESYVALSIEPNGDYDSVYDKLSELEKEGVFEFETCEERVEGSFDDVPEEIE